MKKIPEKTIFLILILFAGSVLRILLAAGPYNSDVRSFIEDAELFRQGKNLYLSQPVYSYTPLFFILMGILGYVERTAGFSSFAFTERSFLSLVDIVTVIVLMQIARQRKLSELKTAALFFLNPISVIITGHHGQFDNLSILFLLIGIYLAGKKIIPESKKTLLIWLSLTTGIIIKHGIVFQVLIFWFHYLKRKWKAVLLFVSSIGVFLLTFVPYLPLAWPQINRQVFTYIATVGTYGTSYALYSICGMCYPINGIDLWSLLRSLFMLAFIVFVFIIHARDLARACLVAFLFFLTFTSGIAAQYFVMPIALGALFPTKWFYLYSVVAGLFAIGNWDELNFQPLQAVSYNTVWLFAALWFLSEMMILYPKLRKPIDSLLHS